MSSAVLFFAAGAVSFKISSSQHHESAWKGYYQLIFSDEISSGTITRILSANGFGNFISAENQRVRVFSYGSPEYVSVNRLPEYFVGSDPAYDPYLRGLGGYFRGRADGMDVQVIYLPADSSPFRTYVKLKRVLSPVSGWWSFVDFQPVQRMIYFGLILVLNVSLFLLTRGNRKMFFVTFLSWFFPLVFGGLPSLISAASYQFCWILLSSHLFDNYKYYLNYRCLDREKLRKSYGALLFSAGVYVSVFILFYRESGFLIPFVSFLMQLSGTAAVLLFMHVQHAGRIHKLFFPVEIKDRKRIFNLDELYTAGAFFVFLFLAPLLYQFSYTVEKITLPAPVSVTKDKTVSFLSLKNLFNVKTDGALPDLSDYVAHMAFIDGYLYGRDYGFPSADEQVGISVYKKEGAKVYRENLMVNMFTDSWYKSIITSAEGSGLTGMLLNQKVPSGVRSVDVHRLTHIEGRLKTYYLFYVFLLFPFLFLVSGVISAPEDRIKRLFIRRRRQVV